MAFLSPSPDSPQLASTVVSPLFTKATIDFMTRKLTGKESALWNQLGGNWIITSDQWPSFRPLPPEYEIRFSDGCVPPNLHNTTDLPANFPTLDTLPRDNVSRMGITSLAPRPPLLCG